MASVPSNNPRDELKPAFTFPSLQVRIDPEEPAPAAIADAEDGRPHLAHHLTEPQDVHRYRSPMRQHRRTPSAHREVKETLDAQTEFSNEDFDGRTHHCVNQYTILEEIGRGSYGAVHLAKDQFGQQYAVKEFSKTRLRRRHQSNILRQGPRLPRPLGGRPDADGPSHGVGNLGRANTSDESDALRFIREEIAIMKKLNHENLVQLFEVLDDPEEDSLYMVLEMCKKGVVMKVGLDEQAVPYPEETCRHWFRDLILGIEYLHAQGVIHRDIKPENLLLSDNDVLKIVDFGVSEMFQKNENMRIEKSAGSPAFLPPELCGKHSDVSGTAADIWSMGVCLYCLRYGKIPFNRDGVLDMYEAIKCDEPTYPKDENPDFLDLMSRLLTKDPERRITMSQLREHPWVTCNGEDPLLSSEENCTHMIEPPNELDLSRALTRKMNHLIYVMRAMNRFKIILTRKRAESAAKSGSPFASPRAKGSFDPAQEKAKAEMIETFLSQKRNFLAQRALPAVVKETEDGAKDAETAAERPPTLFLGIGTGARDDFAMDEASPDVVSDSPTAVDFDVYDRAYENEVERIKTQSREPTLYQNRFFNSSQDDKGPKPSVANLASKLKLSDAP